MAEAKVDSLPQWMWLYFSSFVAASYSGARRNVEAAIDDLNSAYLPHVDLRDALKLVRVRGGHGRLVTKMKRALSDKEFTVAAAGHSVCAGHGNYFNESYAMVLDRALRRGFQAAGIDARARNFGMGGSSAVPLAWCLRDVFVDADVVLWDFNMVEGKAWRLSEVYARAAWSLDSQPLVGMLTNDPSRLKMLEHYSSLPSVSLPVPEELAKLVLPKRPHGDVPHALVDIGFAPKNERDKRRKFSTPDGAPGRVPWHPGWRVNKLFGTFLAVWLLTALSDALGDLETSVNWDDSIVRLPNSDQPHCGDPSLACDTPLHECATAYEPKLGRDVRSLVVGSGWPVVLAKGDPAMRAKQLGLGYLDRKYTLEGRAALEPAVFELDNAKAGRLILCEATTGWRRPPDLGNLDEDVVATVRRVPNDGTAGDRILRLRRLRQVSNCYEARFDAGQAGALLIVNASNANKYVYISHIIWA